MPTNHKQGTQMLQVMDISRGTTSTVSPNQLQDKLAETLGGVYPIVAAQVAELVELVKADHLTERALHICQHLNIAITPHTTGA